MTKSEMITLAKSQVGNSPSKYRNWYYGNYGSGINWCAVFCSWLASQAGLINKCFVSTDGAGCFARYGVPKGYGKWIKSSPNAGDLILYRYGGSYTDQYHSDHVGYVVGVDGNYIYTVEGNTGSDNADLSRVNARTRSKSDSTIWGYYRPNYPDYNDTQEDEMNFKKGDASDGVLAFKGTIHQLHELGVIKADCDATDNSVGSGTVSAIAEIQKLCKLEVDKIAGKKTISAANNLLSDAIAKCTEATVQRQGDWNIGVYQTKTLLQLAKKANIIKSDCDNKFGFGGGTEACVRELQKALEIGIDGEVGKITAEAMRDKLLSL